MQNENKSIATRVSYGKALVELGGKYNFVVMDADLSGSTNTGKFAAAFPERFVNCGIAEANMISTAAGIATTGVPVFASSFAMFAAGRAFEQIRNSVAYPALNVKICATHAGVTVGEDGATHQCLEDFAIMRALPNMTVICPADDAETAAAVEAALLHNGPVYMRLGRQAVPQVFDKETVKFELGKAVAVREGSDCAVFATGVMLSKALEAYEILKAEDIEISVINVSTLKPLDTETVVKYAAKAGCAVTAEEHSVIGGLGSAVCECLAEKCPVRVGRLGMYDVFGRSGKAGELLDYYSLNAEGIAAKVRETIALVK